MPKRRGFTIVEILIAITVLALLMITVIRLMTGSRKETTQAMGKLASRQEARLAFRKMCNEVREASKLILPDNDIHYATEKYVYKYKKANPDPEENPETDGRYGPPTNSLFIENYEGEIISYYYYHEEDGNQHQLRRLDMTKRAKEPDTKSTVVAKGVRAEKDSSSIFRVARCFPGKQPSSVLIKLSIQEEGLSEEKKTYYSLMSSVYLRNVGPLVRKD